MNGRSCALLMSGRRLEFPKAPTRAREPRTDGADRDAKRERRILVRELHPGAERKDVPFMPGKLREQIERTSDLLFVVEPLVRAIGEGRLRWR